MLWAEEDPAAMEPAVLPSIPEEGSPSSRLVEEATWASGCNGSPGDTPGSEEELIADCPAGYCGACPPQGFAQHAAVPSEYLQMQLQLSRELCLLGERLQRLECKAQGAAESHLEAQLAQVVEAGRRDAEYRRELAETFAAALQEERDARLGDMSDLHDALKEMSQAKSIEGASHVGRLAADIARAGAEEADRVARVAGAERDALAESLRGLGARLLEDLSEQHTQAALDLADRHLEAARALDARSAEVGQLAASLTASVREEAKELQGMLRGEVTESVRTALAELLRDLGLTARQDHREDSPLVHCGEVCGIDGSVVALLPERANSYHGSSVTTCFPSGDEEQSAAVGTFQSDCHASVAATECSAESCAADDGAQAEGVVGTLAGEAVRLSLGEYVDGTQIAAPLLLCNPAVRDGTSEFTTKGKPLSARPVAKVWGLDFLKESGCLHPIGGRNLAG